MVRSSNQLPYRPDPCYRLPGRIPGPFFMSFLTIKAQLQRVATHGNGFGLFWPFSGSVHLPPGPTGCAHTLHKRSILPGQIRDEKTDLGALESPTDTRDHLPCREGVKASTALAGRSDAERAASFWACDRPSRCGRWCVRNGRRWSRRARLGAARARHRRRALAPRRGCRASGRPSCGRRRQSHSGCGRALAVARRR
jgi:hypothetical protein